MVFELLDFSTWDPVTIGTTIFGIIGITVAMFKGYQKSGIQGMYNAFVDGMTSSIPQTPEQTKAILAAPAETWKMADDNKDMLWTWLRAKGREFTRTDLDAVITWAELEVQVEYAIVIVDHKGNVDDTTDHAFVSYGTPLYGKYAEIEAKAKATASKVYHLETK